MRRMLVPAVLAACLLVPGAAFAGDDPPTAPSPPTVAPADVLQQANDATARFARRNLVRLLNQAGFDVRGRATLDAAPDTQCATFVTARIPRAFCLFEFRVSERLQAAHPKPWESRSVKGHTPPGPPPRPTQRPVRIRHFECIGAVRVALNPPSVTPLGVDCIRGRDTFERPSPTPYPGPHPYPTPAA